MHLSASVLINLDSNEILKLGKHKLPVFFTNEKTSMFDYITNAVLTQTLTLFSNVVNLDLISFKVV